MAQTSVIAIAGAALLVSWPDGAVGSMIAETPPVACAQAVVRTVEERIDYLGEVFRLAEHGARHDSLPQLPSDARLAVCHR